MIHHGDALDVLKTLGDESCDILVTDPPYGLAFMQKAWDKALPDIRIFKETLRVLKPGAFAFVMSAPRSDVCSRMAILLEEAGFNIAFTPIYWTYASGFPKAMNIGKMVDKRNGRSPKEYKELGAYLRLQRGSRPQKELAALFPSKTGKLTGCVANWELGLNVPTKAQYTALKTELRLDNRFDQLIEREEAEREILATRSKARAEGQKSALPTQGAKTVYIDVLDTAPATDAARALDGSYGGFQPKPAVEVIIVAMKPLSEKTYVDQALKNGKGITWLDDVRVPITDNTGVWGTSNKTTNPDRKFCASEGKENYRSQQHDGGRFPANLLVSDDVLNDGVVRKSGYKDPTKNYRNTSDVTYGEYGDAPSHSFNDSGSYSRFFSLDAWAQTLPFLIVPKANKGEKNEGLESLQEKQTTGGGGGVGNYLEDVNSASGKFGSEKAPAKNNHPTVKPLKLMSYLITLGSRPGDTVLDPFAGSGTTCVAAKQLGRRSIGIEREREYCDMAEMRLAAVQPTLLTQPTVENK